MSNKKEPIPYLIPWTPSAKELDRARYKYAMSTYLIEGLKSITKSFGIIKITQP